MTGGQLLSLAIVAGAIATFAWGRFRYDLVALVALVVAIVTGDVAPKQAFTGFTSDVVIVIASALVVSAAVGRSGAIELLINPLIGGLRSAAAQVPVLAGLTALLSMLTKNVGALAILMPSAIRLGRSPDSSPSSLLMPMSFLSLLGGLVTLVGTSTNIIVSQVREEELGHPFALFDFAPVGLVLTLIGLVVVSVGWRLLPRDRQGHAGVETVAAEARYATDALIPDDWPDQLATLADLKLGDDGIEVAAIVEPDGTRHAAGDDAPLAPGQLLLLSGDDDALARVFGRLPLKGSREAHATATDEAREEVRSIEAVVQPDSVLAGRSAKRADLQDRFGVKLLAVSRQGRRSTERLRDIVLRSGDMLVIQSGENTAPEAMRTLGLLPLADRSVRLGSRPRRFVPLLILLAAIGLVAFGALPVAAAFFSAAVAVVAVGALPMRDAYGALEPEVLVLIGALTPLSEAVQHSGATQVIAGQLTVVLHHLTPLMALGVLMVIAMACAPFLHNAPTVLVLGPISVALARALHLNPDPFLMAVATGAGCDFLTPIGHQCNTLVMGPGGYRFGDYWRLGLPLSITVIVVGTPLIAWVWPLTQ